MKRSLQALLLLSPFIVLALLYLIFQFTDPAEVGPGGVLGVFMLLYLGCLSVLFILIRFGVYWVRWFMLRRSSGGREVPRIEARKAYYVASVLAFAPVTLLAMHAYSQLQLTDVLLVGLLMSVVTFYILKRR